MLPVLGNSVEATFDFVERTKFQRKTRSTVLPFLATKSNVASTLLLVWTGLNINICIPGIEAGSSNKIMMPLRACLPLFIVS